MVLMWWRELENNRNEVYMIIFNCTTRNESMTSKVVDSIKDLGIVIDFKKSLHILSRNMLCGKLSLDFELALKSSTGAIVLVMPSYYNFPSPIFLDWIMSLNAENINQFFGGRNIYLVSVQNGNLNELPIHNVRQLLQKVFDYNNTPSFIYRKHCMVNENIDTWARLRTHLEQLATDPSVLL